MAAMDFVLLFKALVLGIVEGLNPTLIRLKLTSYDDQPKPKAKAPKDAKEGKAVKTESAPKTAPAA